MRKLLGHLNVTRQGWGTARIYAARAVSLFTPQGSQIVERRAGAQSLEGAKKVAIFLHYDRRGTVHDYVLHYLMALRRIGYEIFPQYVSILGIQPGNVKTAMDIKVPADLVRTICEAYSRCVVGEDAGMLAPEVHGSTVLVTDTTIIPCQLQMGVFLGAGKLTGLFRENVLVEKRCRNKGDSVCSYEFVF